MIWWAYVIYVAIVLFGAGNPEYSFDETIGMDVIDYKYDKTIQYLSIYHFVGFLWVTNFILALSEMIVASVVAIYYFTREPRSDNLPTFVLLTSFKRAFRYHIGSLAFGSLIITICQIVRLILEYIHEKTKDSESSVVKFIVKCLRCYFKCLEKFLKFINRNSYILIAIHGDNFFTSCKNAFNLILRNVIRVATLNWAGDFTLFLGRIFVSAITTGLALYYFSTMNEVQFVIVPAVIVFLLSYFTAGAFNNIFKTGIDSVFMCFLEDSERNDGSPGYEPFSPPEISNHLTNHKKL